MGKTIYTTITTVLSCCLLIVVIAMCVPSVHASFVDSTIESSNRYAELKQKYEALNLNIEDFDPTKVVETNYFMATTSQGYNTDCPVFPKGTIPSLSMLNDREIYINYRSMYPGETSIFTEYFGPDYYATFDEYITNLSYTTTLEDGSEFYISTRLVQGSAGLYTVKSPVFYFNDQLVTQTQFETMALQNSNAMVAMNYVVEDKENKSINLVFGGFGFNGVYQSSTGLYVNFDNMTYNLYGVDDNYYSSGFSHWPEDDWETTGNVPFALNIYSNSSGGKGDNLIFTSTTTFTFKGITFTKQ